MKVLKFGGTSVGSAESLQNVKSIIEHQKGQVIVVVSALGGVTNLLLEMTSKAHRQDDSYTLNLQQLLERHLSVIEGIVPQQRQQQCKGLVTQFINAGLAQLYGIAYANPQLPASERARIEDSIVCHGEILSSAIVSCMIDDAVPHYSPNFIKTQDVGGERILDNQSFELIEQEFKGRNEKIHVTQGFISEDSLTGQKTNLGRGGSDFTAALIAAALDADSLEIWTDVDGFYTTDPNKDPHARLIERMTYQQAQQLCDAGAKVIYAPTLSPVALKRIPVWVKNTFNPGAPGTVILDHL